MVAMSHSIGIPWDQTAYYITASDRATVSGGPMVYGMSHYLLIGPSHRYIQTLSAVPHRTGKSLAGVTDSHPRQYTWSANSIPDVLYMLKPPREWYIFLRMYQATGAVYRLLIRHCIFQVRIQVVRAAQVKT